MKWISVDCLHWSKIRFIHKYLARNLSFYKESLLKIKLWKGFHHIVPKVQKYPRVWKHPAGGFHLYLFPFDFPFNYITNE